MVKASCHEATVLVVVGVIGQSTEVSLLEVNIRKLGFLKPNLAERRLG
jgi:hypothetical protein